MYFLYFRIFHQSECHYEFFYFDYLFSVNLNKRNIASV